MLLKKLIFNNYKTFYGSKEIDLYIPEKAQEKGQNILLVGGLNGAGKTTILKAILYVLFGERGMTKEEHKRLFSNVINNNFFNEGGRQSSVSLIIETDAKEEWHLKVKWYFDKNSKLLNHEERELIISRPGVRAKRHVQIQNIEVYNKYIDRIIPYHAAPFFIFDGEEIKDIILRQNSHEMVTAIHKITGMEAYDQLIIDLENLANTLQRKVANAVDNNKLKSLHQQNNELEKEIDDTSLLLKKYSTRYNKLEEQLNIIKQQRNEKISSNSRSREVLVKTQSRFEMEFKMATEEYETAYNENILSMILKDKLIKLKKQLNTEKEIRRNRLIEQTALKPYQEFINQLLNKEFNPPLSEQQLNQITEFGKEVWRKQNNITNSENLKNAKEIHDLSIKEQQYLLTYKIRDVNSIIEAINKIQKLENEMSTIENKIRNAPEAVDIEEENNKIDTLTKDAGAISLRIQTYNRKLTRLKNQKTDIQNQLSRLESKNTNVDEIAIEYKLLKKTIKALTVYIDETTKMKASFIQEEFANILKKLFRKQDEFGKIEFDIDTYTVRLYNDKLQEISIQDRSAGEMQMISSSLIWALTKVSDLSLPIVVDTPLGRLDSLHRNRLIKYYYKNISNQVIILSTDTEITDEYIELMSVNSYKQYLLDYDETKKYTIIRDGYFNFIKK